MSEEQEEIEEARKLLLAADLFYDNSENDSELAQVLNMNDVWGWGCADCEHVPDNKLDEVARLFRAYGWAGVLYWVSEQREQCRSEFADNNRFIDFVRHEEVIRREVPDSNKRAYHKATYTIGGSDD